METFFATITPMLTLFICIAAGFTVHKCKLLPENSGTVIAKMETWIFYPALCFTTMLRYCTIESVSTHAVNILLSALCVSLSLSISIPLSRLFVRENTPERGVFAYALAFANSGYLGDPVVQAMFGDEVLSYYKLFCLPISIAIYTWGLSVLVPSSNGEKKGSSFKKIFNAPMVSTLIGIVAGLVGAEKYIPAFFLSTLDTLKACMGPLAMLLAGITIARYNLLGMLKKGRVYVAALLRLVVLPSVIIAFLFGVKSLLNAMFSLEIGNSVLFLAFFATASALGLNTVVFPEAYGGNPETGAGMALISHTLAVITIPLMYALLVTIFGPLSI